VFKFSFKGYITADLYSMLIGTKMVKGLTVRDARTSRHTPVLFLLSLGTKINKKKK
jgi:hypothetical protein